MSSDLSDQKKITRRRCFAALKELSTNQKRFSSEQICQQLGELDSFRSAGTVFAYLPLPSEPNLTSLFDDSKRWGFPRVMPDDSMEFRRMGDLSQRVESKFKIPEPDPEACELLDPQSADLVLIPGLGFQKEKGDRLGRGKGHYDRFLQGVIDQKKPPLLVGICFSVQLGDVPSEIHDIPMDLVISG